MKLSPIQYAVLSCRPGHIGAGALSAKLGENADAVRNAAFELAEMGLLSSDAKTETSLELTQEGRAAAREGLPESRLVAELGAGPKPTSALPPELVRFGLPNAKKSGLVSIASGVVSLTDEGARLLNEGRLPSILDSPEALSGLSAEAQENFQKRGLLLRSEKTETIYTIAKNAASSLDSGEIGVEEEGVGQLTRDMLLDGTWRGKPMRPYDVSAPAAQAFAARRHPISALRDRMRAIFCRMGFEEMSGPHVESSFWNFDALFQPQDHPARDLADTFYVSGNSHLPSHALAQRVRHAHEAGWKSEWSEAPAKKRLLRTHTTAVSARTLAKTAEETRGGKTAAGKAAAPGAGGQPASSGRRFFCVGKVFRNEATDYKHLAEFFQVEGIVSYEKATFSDLLGTLSEFYRQLGFQKIRFRPSFFPYTEPSLEIEVYYEPRQAWLELGGAGMLRPEVCGPLGAPYPTLAWGLSLERPLMISNKIDDIRAFYRNELGWLRNFPII